MPKLLTILIVVLFASACASSPAPAATSEPLPPATADVLVLPTAAPNPEPVTPATLNVAQVQQVQVEPPPTGESGEPLVARINGEGITRASFDRAMARAQQQIGASDADALQSTVLDSMIEQVLIEQAAADENVTISDEALEAEYQANRAMVADDAAWQQWLEENLYTDEEFRDSLRAALIAGAMRDRVTADIPEVALHVHARHILVETEDEANNVLAQLQGGADFAALAATQSRDVTTRDQGGDLGWFVEGELLEPVLTQVAFSLEDGQIAGPIATRLGYHVIQKLGSEMRALTPEQRALLAQISFENWLRGLTFNAIIERYLT